MRDLYALAAFYIANPEHPLPHQVYVSHDVSSETELRQLARDFDTPVFGGGEGSPPMLTHALGNASINVTLAVTAR